MPHHEPISLTDTVVTQFAEPLAPPDRSAFLAALANLLRHEPRPVGDSAIHRAAKQLLATGHYGLNWTLAAPRHHQQSRLRHGAAILNSQSR